MQKYKVLYNAIVTCMNQLSAIALCFHVTFGDSLPKLKPSDQPLSTKGQ